MGIAVDDTQLFIFFLDFLQRADDERNRGAYLVSHHREEVQTGFASLLLLLLLQLLQFLLMPLFHDVAAGIGGALVMHVVLKSLGGKRREVTKAEVCMAALFVVYFLCSL